MYIVKNVIGDKDISMLYNHAIKECTWNIGTSYAEATNPKLEYPTHLVFNSRGMHNPFLAGYFLSTLSVIRKRIEDEHGFSIPTEKISTIGCNAQRKGNISQFHEDADENGAHSWSIVGFLTPQWDPSWGGDLQIEDKTVTYQPGDFVVYRSNLLHDALPIKVDTPFWRVTVACLLR